MSIENRVSDTESDEVTNVIHVNFPQNFLRGYAILPPTELRTDPQGPWVSVDYHRDGADWVYAVGAAQRSSVATTELEISEVS